MKPRGMLRVVEKNKDLKSTILPERSVWSADYDALSIVTVTRSDTQQFYTRRTCRGEIGGRKPAKPPRLQAMSQSICSLVQPCLLCPQFSLIEAAKTMYS